MWHNVKVGRPRGHERAHHGAGHRHHGFSHPVRFEVLESRLALSVAPATGGLPGVDNVAGPASGSNPANFSPGNTTGSGVALEGNALDNQQVAFNTPYWVANDRPELKPSPSDQLPANVNQQANTPQGIRNFSFGPDTSTHFSTPVRILTARRPMEEVTGRNWVAGNSLDDSLLGDTLLVDVLTAAETLDSRQEVAAVESPDEAALLNRQSEPATDPSPSLELILERPETRLEATAVDQTMADQNAADTARADAAIVQVVADDATEPEPGTGTVVYALAASLASVTTVPIRQHVWDNTDIRRGPKARRGVRR